MQRKDLYTPGVLVLLVILSSLLLLSCGNFPVFKRSNNTAPVTYTIGGTVSGLSGTLVLQNNGGNNLTRTTNGSFIFSSALNNGASYNVTVSSQPAGQICTVANGSATVNAANVTNVQISCANSTYTVGGSTSGLNGTVVLQNNSANDLTLTSNGSFTFSTALNNGTSYNVTVSSQPAGQTCSVTNGSGTISAANVTNAQVSCTNNTYTVGGTLSGLSGSVVLQNNGGDNLTLTANGSFAFATEVAHSAAYSVTVSSQPAGKTCSVTNGSGTIGAANITNVTVSCQDSTYTVGGSVGGINGTVVLQNNGGDNKTITAIGAFAFTTQLTNGTAYSVTVLTQPTGQICTVTNGSGTISLANVTNIQVACADVAASGWTNPTDISDGIETAGDSPQRFQVALAQNGDAVISYIDRVDEGGSSFYWHVFLSERRGDAWHHPQGLSEKVDLDRDQVTDSGDIVTSPSDLKPQVAMSDNGDTVITWNQENQDGLDCAYMSEKRNGVWIRPADLSDRLNIGPYQSNLAAPQVAMAGDGDTLVVWDQTGPSAVRLFMRERRDGAWLPYTIDDYISPDNAYASWKPRVSMADTGAALVSWEERVYQSWYERRVMMSEYPGAGPWVHPASRDEYINPTALINGSELGYADSPRTAISNNGDAIIVWRQNVIFDNTQYSPSRNYLFMSEYDSGTQTWTDPQTLDDFINLDTGYSARDHQVAMDDNGNAVIVWEQTDATGTFNNIYMLEKSGGAWAASPVVISPDGSSSNEPQVAMAGSGDAVIIWLQRDSTGSFEQIFMSEKRNGAWAHPGTLDDYISLDGDIGGSVDSNENGPHLAIDDSGNTLIVWEQYDVNNGDAELMFMSEYRK